MLSNNFEQPDWGGTFKRGVLLLIFICLGIVANAQNFNSSRYNSSNGDRASIFTQQQSYQSYQSVVYEPFSNTLPSERGASKDEPEFDITGRKNGFITPSNPNESDESPVGEPWVMLLMAAMAAGVVARKRKIAEA